MKLYERYFKRLLDVILSLLGIIILSPVMLFTAILVRTKLGSPVIFKQARPGKNEKIFNMYKFRSMTDQKDNQGNLLSDDIRLTPFGKKLRSTSLDELPELFNILKGDMSLVGPRPLLTQYLDLYNDEQKQRHNTRPGLTGLAQVNGRNAISWEQKFKLDKHYTDKITFMKDLKIMLRTIKVILLKDGINSDTSQTNEAFLGTEVKR